MSPPEKHKILVLDDDEIILVALKETLGSEGLDVHTVNDASIALDIVKEQEFAVIISDQRMPEMTGLEFFTEAKRIQPNATRILITGVLNLKTVIDAINKGEIFRFLAKPWIREELLATINNAIQRYNLLQINRKLQEDTLKLNDQLAASNDSLHQQLQQLRKNQDELTSANESLDRNFRQSVQLCERILFSFYPILGKQARMIERICTPICETGYLSDEQQETLKVAALLQNIGLIGVSREVIAKLFNKPQDLTPEERKAIYNHPAHGEALSQFGHRFRNVGATIRAHHERWDGKGYPDGLSGDSIPQTARVLSIAVYYVESGLPREQALEEIVSQSGKAFDPEAVRLFLKTAQSNQLPRQVREVLLDELKPGQVLASNIHSPTGLLLVPENERLSEDTIQRIHKHELCEGFHDRLLVYL